MGKMVDNMKTTIIKYDLKKLAVCFEMHPVASVALGVVVALYAIPISLFLAFTIISFIAVLMGSLIFEGILLLGALFVLMFVLTTMTAVIVLVPLAFAVLYFVLKQLYYISYDIVAKASSDLGLQSSKYEDPFIKKEKL